MSFKFTFIAGYFDILLDFSQKSRRMLNEIYLIAICLHPFLTLFQTGNYCLRIVQIPQFTSLNFYISDKDNFVKALFRCCFDIPQKVVVFYIVCCFQGQSRPYRNSCVRVIDETEQTSRVSSLHASAFCGAAYARSFFVFVCFRLFIRR